MQGIQSKRAKLKASAEEYAQKLGAVTLSFTLKLGEAGKSFGAITSRDIEASLKGQGFEVTKKQIRLLEPLRVAGSYKVDVKVHAEVVASLPVVVQSEAPKKAAASEEEGAPKGKKKGAPKKGSKKAASDETTEQSAETQTEADAS